MQGLINAGQDNEFYPSTKEMIEPIYKAMVESDVGSVLDIGAGPCNFKKFINEFNEVESKKVDEWGNRRGKHIRFDYYVIEKSRILINNFEKDVIVIGTNFHSTLLLDKPVDVIFCNPPYSEYETWVTRSL